MFIHDPNVQQQVHQMTLMVINAQLLEAGLCATCTFDDQGGSIGSGIKDNWVLRDTEGTIGLAHAKIVFIDDQFCLNDTYGACYINGATIPVGLANRVKLNEADVIKIGAYQLRVHLSNELDLDGIAQRGLEQNITQKSTDIFLCEDEFNDDHERSFAVVIDDPIIALDNLSAQKAAIEATRSSHETSDLSFDHLDISLQSFTNLNLRSQQIAQDLLATPQSSRWLKSDKCVGADSEYDICSAIVMKKKSRSEGSAVDDIKLESLEEEMRTNYDFSHQWPHQDDKEELAWNDEKHVHGQHLLVSPIQRGLGCQIGNLQNMGEMQALTEEIAASLQAAIKGLLDLNQQVGNERLGGMNKNLQPIEDNPLRLGLSYRETMKTLFDCERSVVHLSAPAAIDETLKNIRLHNSAVNFAISNALEQVLHAFSPDVLMRRFASYRRAGQVQPESTDAWAWDMYQCYYQELTSDRQKGFGKLFWEIFDQAYDKAIREKQREI